MARIADVFIRLLSDATGFAKDVVKQGQLAGDQAGAAMGASMAAAISKNANRIGASLMSVGKNLSDTGASMSRNLTLPIVAAGAAAGKLALDFDTSLRQISGLTDVTQDELAGIKDEILAMGPAVGKGPQELVEAFYFVASAGFTASEAMDVLKTSAEASAAGLGETQTIAQVLGGVLNAYGKENINAADAAGILTEAVSQGTAEASGFANVIGRVVPAAATLGVSFDQVTAALAGMTLTGLDAEESAVGLNQVFVSLLKPTKDAEGALTDMGLSAAGLRQQLKEEGLLSVLRTLEERFGGNEEAAARVFGNVRALRTVTSLLTLDTEQLNAIFEKTANSGAARLAEAYDETEGPARDLARAWSELEATAIELGTDVLPVFVDLLQGVAEQAKGLSTLWSGMDDGLKRLIVTLLSLAAAMGPVLFIGGKLLQGFGALFKVVGFLAGSKGIPALIKVMKAGGLAFTGTLGTVLALGVALGEGAIAFGDWTRNLGKSRKEIKQFNDLVELTGEVKFAEKVREWGVSIDDFRLLVEAAGGDGKAAFEVLQDAGGDLSKALEELGVDVGSMSQHWAEAWREMSTAVETEGGFIVSKAGAMGEEVPEEFSASVQDGAVVVSEGADEGIVDPMQAAYEEAIQAAADAGEGIINALLQELAEGPKDLKQVLKDLKKALENPFTVNERRVTTEAELANKAFRDALKSGDPRLEATAFDSMQKLLHQYELVAPGALDKGKLVNPKFQDGINSNLAAALQWVQDNVTGPYTNLFDLAEVLETMGYDSLASYARGVQTARTLRLVPEITAAQREAKEGWNVDLFGTGYNVGSSYVNGILSALRNMFPAFFGAIDPFLRLFGFAGSPMYSHATELGEGVATHWVKALANGLAGGVPDLASMLAFDAPMMTSTANFRNASGIANAAAPAGNRGGGDTYNVYLPGRERRVTADNIGRDLGRLERTNKIRVRRVPEDD